ncbi:MAG: putative Ig domain-containing protein, partial [Thioalkalivibrio sp.]|nr:putative Ig domain-containing protein [Thioalkalivibrio sp.]
MLACVLFGASLAHATVSPAERAALVDLYNSTNGAAWTRNTNWLSADECTWYGVTCGPAVPTGQPTVVDIYLQANNLVGPLPASLGNLTNLENLAMAGNRLSGTIPSGLGALTRLRELYLNQNELTGSIPPELQNLINLEALDLWINQLSGSIPPELGKLTSLRYLWLQGNRLTGPIPPELGALPYLIELYLHDNQLSGSIPPEVASMSLWGLTLSRNQLSGSMPAEWNAGWNTLLLSGNQLSGSIPPSLANLPLNEADSMLDIRWNALYSEDPALTSYLNSKQYGGDWQSTQTIAPSSLTTSDVTPTTVGVSWSPIAYTADSGFYQISYATAPGGPYTAFSTTPNKSSSSLTVTDLQPSTTYYFVATTTTQPHASNANSVTSGFSTEVSASTGSQNLPPVVDVFEADPPAITVGQSSMLIWSTTNATEVSITGVQGVQPPSGSVLVGPVETTTYTLTATGPFGTATRSTTLRVNAVLSIDTTALPTATVGVAYSAPLHASGGQSPYYWSVSAGLPPGLKIASTSGTISGTPTAAGTFDVTISVRDGSSPQQKVSKAFSIVVKDKSRPAEVVVSSFPEALLQLPDRGGATTGLTLTNAGDVSTAVTVARNGEFFTLAPDAFDLAPGASREVLVTGLARPSGEYEGSIAVSGVGVPAGLRVTVRMLVTAPPSSGEAQARADENRVDVAAPADQDRVEAEVGFTNVGT